MSSYQRSLGLNDAKKKITGRFLKRDGHFNIEYKGVSWWKLYRADTYHYITNMSWLKLVLVTILYWTLINCGFATLYWIDLPHLGGVDMGNWLDALFFSIQTTSTIGYGFYHPTGYYLNSVVVFHAWFAFISNALFVAVLISKFQRPSRLRHTIKFSESAVINSATESFHMDNSDWNPTGLYQIGTPVLSFRILNLRKRLLCMPEIRLLMLRRENKKYAIHELDFDINYQIGRVRADGVSKPHLSLPWTVTHQINKFSPLHGKTKEQALEEEFEIICIFDAIDELSSMNFQSRWSYLPDEIKWGHKFIPMVKLAENGKFIVDSSKISDTQSLLMEGIPDESTHSIIDRSESSYGLLEDCAMKYFTRDTDDENIYLLTPPDG